MCLPWEESQKEKEKKLLGLTAVPSSAQDNHIEVESWTVGRRARWSWSAVSRIDGADEMTAMLRGSVTHLSNKMWFCAFSLLVPLRLSGPCCSTVTFACNLHSNWNRWRRSGSFSPFFPLSSPSFLDFPLPLWSLRFVFFFVCIDAKWAQIWHDFHWEQDGCLCKALWNGWVASVWKEFWREVFYLTHHLSSSETNKPKYTITAEIKLKIKNWVILKQRGFRSVYWPCVRKSRTVPTLLAPSCGKAFSRLNLKHPSATLLLQSFTLSLPLWVSLIFTPTLH